jgi:hypothetical protein
MDLNKILSAITQFGAATPAFKALFDEVKSVFGPTDQQTLQAAYAKVRAENDAGHADLQAELKAAESK